MPQAIISVAKETGDNNKLLETATTDVHDDCLCERGFRDLRTFKQI